MAAQPKPVPAEVPAAVAYSLPLYVDTTLCASIVAGSDPAYASPPGA